MHRLTGRSAVTLLLLAFVLPQISYAQEIPILKDVQVRAKARLDPTTQGKYTYSFNISNPATNTGKIRALRVDVSKPESGMDLKSEGLYIDLRVNNEGEMISHSFLEEFKALESEMEKEPVPVGLIIPNPFWITGLSIIGTVSWGSKGPEHRIMPGKKMEGFKLESYGIPAIRSFEVIPAWILVVEGSVGPGDIEKSRRIKEEIVFHGETIGPTAPPAEFVALDFVSHIESLKHQATELGWITNKGVENSLDVKLNNVRKKLESGNIKAATNVLNAFISEVEAQGCASYDDCPNGKHVLPEAWALLKFNAEYLLGQL